MTRINQIPVEELSDQHLIREYNEIPRFIKQDINIEDAPTIYCLGKGHVKWGRKHWVFCLARYSFVCNEMYYRGFTVNYTHKDLSKFTVNTPMPLPIPYIPTEQDIELSRNRIIEKIKMKPNWYRWTKRERPSYTIFN